MNLLNTYIKNDDGELRELYIKEAEKQGFVQSMNTSNNYPSRYITVSESYNEIWSVSSSRMHTDKELTLKDLVDPYEELKQAYKEGKTLQVLGLDDEWVDLVGEPNFKSRIEFYRIKPEDYIVKPSVKDVYEALNGDLNNLEYGYALRQVYIVAEQVQDGLKYYGSATSYTPEDNRGWFTVCTVEDFKELAKSTITESNETENDTTKQENDVKIIPEQNTDLTLTGVQNTLPEDFYLRVCSDKFIIINHNTRQEYEVSDEKSLLKVLDALTVLEEFKK